MFWHAPENALLSKQISLRNATHRVWRQTFSLKLCSMSTKTLPYAVVAIILIITLLLFDTQIQIFSLSAVLRFCRQVKENRLRSS